MAGVLPFAFFIAYGVMSIPSSMLVQKYNEKTIMVAAFVVAFLGSLLLAAQPNYLTALLSLFLIGCGMAMLQVVINPLLRTAGGEENYAFTSVLAQLIFGGASFLSPLVYSYMVLNLAKKSHPGVFSILAPLVPADMPWLSLYWLFVVMSLLMVVLMLVSRFPKVELAADEKAGAWETHVMLFKRPVVKAYFIALFCYVGTEQGVSYWMSEFLKRYHQIDPETTGASAVAYFWGLMTVGGIFGLILLKIMDSRRLLIAFTIPAIIALSFGLFGSTQVSLIAFPVVGFFMSVMYPIIFSLALSSVDEHHGSFAGILVTGIIGGAVVQLLIGGLADFIGLRGGMMFLYITMGYMLSIGFWAKPLVTNNTSSKLAAIIGFTGLLIAEFVLFKFAKITSVDRVAFNANTILLVGALGFFVPYFITTLFAKKRQAANK